MTSVINSSDSPHQRKCKVDSKKMENTFAANVLFVRWEWSEQIIIIIISSHRHLSCMWVHLYFASIFNQEAFDYCAKIIFNNFVSSFLRIISYLRGDHRFRVCRRVYSRWTSYSVGTFSLFDAHIVHWHHLYYVQYTKTLHLINSCYFELTSNKYIVVNIYHLKLTTIFILMWIKWNKLIILYTDNIVLLMFHEMLSLWRAHPTSECICNENK